jgi:hypothetical protein
MNVQGNVAVFRSSSATLLVNAATSFRKVWIIVVMSTDWIVQGTLISTRVQVFGLKLTGLGVILLAGMIICCSKELVFYNS